MFQLLIFVILFIDGTVFDFSGQFCNWPFLTCAPCGTLDDPGCSGDEICDIGNMLKLKT